MRYFICTNNTRFVVFFEYYIMVTFRFLDSVLIHKSIVLLRNGNVDFTFLV